VVAIVGAVSGVCFAALAARCLSVVAISPHYWRTSSVVYAAITAVLSYLAFRTATSGSAEEDDFMRAMWGGLAGAVVGVVIIFAVLALFRENARAYLARPMGFHLSQVTNLRLVAAFFLLGFGAGFAIRTPTEKR
jgi:hypothetical protein